MPKKPTCLNSSIVARSRLFQIEQLDLEFSNGERRQYERIKGETYGAVIIVAMLDKTTFFLIREYSAATDRYELNLPKGLRNRDEPALDAANRELKEEIGFGANDLCILKAMTASPGYFAATSDIILARDLYPERLPGDEPEELETITWSLENLPELVARDDFTEARSIAALYMARDKLLV